MVVVVVARAFSLIMRVAPPERKGWEVALLPFPVRAAAGAASHALETHI